MSSNRPDFHSYSTKELREVLGFIDREKYPDRVEEVLRILADREHGRLDELVDAPSQSSSSRSAVRTVVDGTSVKKGRSHSLVEGVGSVVFGILWLLAVPWFFARSPEPPPLPFQLIFYGAGVGTIIGGFFAIYNAFARNRFSEFDVVSTDREPDPLSEYLDPEKDERSDGS